LKDIVVHSALSQRSLFIQRESEEDKRVKGALKTKEKRRINELKILHFNDRDEVLINEMQLLVEAFMVNLGLTESITQHQLLDTLQKAHVASDEYYNITHA